MTTIKHPKDSQLVLLKIMQAHLENLRFQVSYYSRLFDPEHREHYGRSVNEKLEDAKDKLEDGQRDYKDFLHYNNGNQSVCYFQSQYDATRAMLDVIRKSLRDAIDYNYNPLIVMDSLRTAVKVRNLLCSLDPEYSGYSATYFRNH